MTNGWAMCASHLPAMHRTWTIRCHPRDLSRPDDLPHTPRGLHRRPRNPSCSDDTLLVTRKL